MMLRAGNTTVRTSLVPDPSGGPAWYEDGNSFLYVAIENRKENRRENRSSRIIKTNINGGGKTYVGRNPVGDLPSNPSVKEGNILFQVIINNKWHIGRMTDKSAEFTIIDEGSQPSWHPLEDKFVFIKNQGVFEMDIKSSQVTELFGVKKDNKGNLVEWCSNPSYSRDGSYVLFSKGGTPTFSGVELEKNSTRRYRKGTIEENRNHIFVMKSDGTDLMQITSGNVNVYYPTWGINDEIYFVSDVQNSTEIWKATLVLN